MQTVTKNSAADKAKAEATIKERDDLIVKGEHMMQNQSDMIAGLTATKIDVFDGQIGWVNQRLGKAWINVGRADALPHQITFSVYPSNATDLTVSGGKKASIEVTRILGDHLAEVRIIDDTISSPIMPGDKIYTPLWAPGDKKHFALAGFMDIVGDGKSHLQTVLDLIKANEGVVDSYINDKGELVGELTVNTRYLILGEAPTEKGDTTQIASFSKMIESAKHLGIQKLPIGDLVMQMGWKNETPVVRFGAGKNPNDFKAKPENGIPQKSLGTVTDLFKPRRPPSDLPPGTMKSTPPGAPASATPPASTAPSSSPPPNAYYRF